MGSGLGYDLCLANLRDTYRLLLNQLGTKEVFGTIDRVEELLAELRSHQKAMPLRS